MRKARNIKTLQYTPAPQKVGHPANRFICETRQDKQKTESELRNHMTIMHSQA